jgi:hypothetical protein
MLLDAGGARLRRDRLAVIPIDAVEGGASVNFLLPFERPVALAY